MKDSFTYFWAVAKSITNRTETHIPAAEIYEKYKKEIEEAAAIAVKRFAVPQDLAVASIKYWIHEIVEGE